jgi:hypothetical protein
MSAIRILAPLTRADTLMADDWDRRGVCDIVASMEDVMGRKVEDTVVTLAFLWCHTDRQYPWVDLFLPSWLQWRS